MSTTNSNSNGWALILGGSSGFGLATAHKLSRHGCNLCVVHRDRRGAMKRIEPEFEAMRARGISLLTYNADALDADKRDEILDGLSESLGAAGKVRVLLHSIAFGNLKLIAPEADSDNDARERLAAAMDVDAPQLAETVDGLFEQQVYGLQGISTAPEYSADAFIEEEDLARTIHSMGTSLLGWTQRVRERGMFASDARILGLTSEGNTVAWKGYAAVAAAKVALESVARSIAVEMAPHGIRCNVIQAGVVVTDPALIGLSAPITLTGVPSVPEPTTAMLIGLGILGLGLAGRRQA